MAYAKISTDLGVTWSKKIALSGSNKRATHGDSILLSSGRIIAPLFAYNDHGSYRVYIVYSDDGGRSWKEVLVAKDNAHRPNEGSLVELKTNGVYTGGLLAVFRTEARPYSYYYAKSTDYGATWGPLTSLSRKIKNPDTACPPDLCRLPDGRIMFTYTRSNQIQCYISADETTTWQRSSILVDRSGYEAEQKHYAKVFPGIDSLFIIWCTNTMKSSVYFNHILLDLLNL